MLIKATEKLPRRFRKLPVVIEAVRWGGTMTDLGALPAWAFRAVDHDASDVYQIPSSGSVLVRVNPANPREVCTCKKGDWIVLGVRGEVYPCTDEIFRATYEEHPR